MMATEGLEKTVERLLAVHEVQQLMGKYEYYLEAAMGEEIVGLFAARTPGVTANIGDWGVFKGIDGVRRLFVGIIGSMMKQPGCLGEADLTTPVIEVAGDGQTAKAVWLSPGFETTRDPRTGEVRTGWCWTKYACDFVKEEGQWRLRHWTTSPPSSPSTTKAGRKAGEHYTRQKGQEQAFPVELAPDGPPLHRHMPYSPDSAPHLSAAFPTPYETYDGSQDWIDPGRAALGNA